MGQASGEQWGRTTGGSPCHPGPAAPLDCGALVGAPGVWRGSVARSPVCHSRGRDGGGALTRLRGAELETDLFVVPAASRSGGGEPGGLWTCLGQDAAVCFFLTPSYTS